MARSRRVTLLALWLAFGLCLSAAGRAAAQDAPKPPDLPLGEPDTPAAPAPLPSDESRGGPNIKVEPKAAPADSAATKANAPEPAAGGAAPVAGAVEPASAPGKKAATVGRSSMLRLFVQTNPMLWPLLLCSVVAVGYALERLIALRRERVIPRDFVNRFLERLSSGKLDRDRALELCKANDSAAARVFALIVSYWGQPAATIRQALGYDAAGEIVDLKRNIRVLNGTATLAPLLGLLGTVVGMIQAFDAVGGRVGPAKGEALAQGISLALVATALGLAIAILSVAVYYFLLNRVDVLVRMLDEQARQVIDLVSQESMRPPGDRRPNLVPPPAASELARPEASRAL